MTTTDDHSVPVKIITSARRKKTVSAKWVGEAIEIRMPEGLSAAERDRHVQTLTKRLIRRRAVDRLDLTERARTLAKQYELPEPASITWSSRQKHRWGSCTPANKTIRISERMGQYPSWVIDHVIVHELAHLVVPNHSPAFYALIEDFPHAEKAEGFLLAVSLGFAGELSGSIDTGSCTED